MEVGRYQKRIYRVANILLGRDSENQLADLMNDSVCADNFRYYFINKILTIINSLPQCNVIPQALFPLNNNFDHFYYTILSI